MQKNRDTATDKNKTAPTDKNKAPVAEVKIEMTAEGLQTRKKVAKETLPEAVAPKSNQRAVSIIMSLREANSFVVARLPNSGN